MKRHTLFCAIVTTLLGASSAFAGGPNQAPISGRSANDDAIDAVSLARAQQKLAHASQIANQFAASASAEGLNDRWRIEMINALMSKPESSFAEVQIKPGVREAMEAAVAPATSSGGTAKDLGDSTDDLTYIPLPSPCRIVDTRPSSGGSGQLLTNTPRNFTFTSANSSQGGSGCTPFTGYVGGGQPGAAALNITVIGGGAAAAGSFLQAYPAGGSTTTSWLNFGAGQIIANEGILGIASTQFTLRTNAAADAIVDVFGSFIRPHATALDCTTATSTSSFLGLVTATCPATYTLTGGGCKSNAITDHTYQAYPSTATDYNCGNWPEGGQTIGTTLTAYAICCRTPGRTN